MRPSATTDQETRLLEILQDSRQPIDRALSLETTPDTLFQLNLKACRSASKTIKNRAAKLMVRIAETKRLRGSKTIESVASFLKEDDRILIWNACITLGHLASDRKTDKIRSQLPILFKLLDNPSMVTAANAIQGLGLIASACPSLTERVTKKLVNADHSFRDPNCQSILAGKVMETIEASIVQPPVPRGVRTFVTNQVDSNRPSTARRAQRFTKRFLS